MRMIKGMNHAILLSSGSVLALASPAAAQTESERLTLPMARGPHSSEVDKDLAKSRQDLPDPVRAPAGAPNVLLILTDDVGFGAASTFGGPVPTPNLDRLAARGLVYNRFHTTAMCSPTRAALLTGRNHHVAGTGALTDFASGFAGYAGAIPRTTATIAEILRDNGYSTAMFGKHHNASRGQMSMASPRTSWPLGLGFENFFGFLGADTDQWRPNLTRDNTLLPNQPLGDILDKRLADEAIHWIHEQQASAPDKPFFVYYAPGSAHTPLQAPADWIAKFRGKFDEGYDVLRQETLSRQVAKGIVPEGTNLAQWPEGIPHWQALSADERKVEARMMEVFAGMLAYQDNQFGRILDELDRMGVAENTLIVFIEGDNGSDAAGGAEGKLTESGEITNKKTTAAQKLALLDDFGGPDLDIAYSAGWAFALDTPFPYFKQIGSHLGGTRNGMVMAWPARIKQRGLRDQFSHVIDIAPTILEAAGIPQPTSVAGVGQVPMQGIPLEYTFADSQAPGRHTTQYFEMLGNRAIYHDGWMAATNPRKMPWNMVMSKDANVNLTLQYDWGLYDLTHDFSQSRDIAKAHPEKLAEMRALFDKEARANQVYPLDDRTSLDRPAALIAKSVHPRNHYAFFGKDLRLDMDSWPALANRGFIIDAKVEVQPGKDTGALVSWGSLLGGWNFALRNGRPTVLHALSAVAGDLTRIAAPASIPTGRPVEVRFAFDYDGAGYGKGGEMTIFVDGAVIARGRIEQTITMAANSDEDFDIGRDTSIPVNRNARDGDEFAGKIERIDIEVGKIGMKGLPSAEN